MRPKIANSIDDLVGDTPLLNLGKILPPDAGGQVLAKLEYFNPAGSVKDRPALAMINYAEKLGMLRKDGVIVEPTSGNMGIGLAAIAAARGYRLIVTMPENMSMERRRQIAAYGAEVELTPKELGMKGALAKAQELARTIPGAFMPGQFSSPANPEAHRLGTGPEIWADTDGKVDIFVAGIGTGGTITGVGEYLKAKNPEIKIIGVEPEDSPALSKGKAGPHKIQGIGAGFVPDILNTKIYDEIITASNERAYETARLAAKKMGILTGISSGAAGWAAIQLARRPENTRKMIVALFPDGGDRYLSTDLYAETKN